VFYVVELAAPSRVIAFNQNWEYQTYYNLPKNVTFAIKYIENQGFYFTADNYFYKTDSNFQLISGNLSFCSTCPYRQMAYNPNNMLFYVSVASSSVNAIHVFTTSCTYQRAIGVQFTPYGINFYNNLMYVSFYGNSNLVYVLQNELSFVDSFSGPCSSMTTITFDSFGYMAISCENINQIYLYNNNGTNTGLSFNLTNIGFYTAVDSYGRFIISNFLSIGIYF
jgi:hypothetical protein